MKRAAAVAVALAVVVHAPTAAAQAARRRFEPTDLNLQPAGMVEVDVQTGLVNGDDGARGYAPDYEVTLGISSHAELLVDGAFGFDAQGRALMLDNTLVALRLGIADIRDTPSSESAWAAGIQTGPRLPTLPKARGIGLEALAIVGRTSGRLHLFVQAGVLLDPFQPIEGARAQRPFGVEGGVDLDLDLDGRDRWSVKAEVGGVKFFSANDPQLHLTCGPAINVTPSLELSAVAIVGLLASGDHYGAVLGALTRFRAF